MTEWFKIVNEYLGWGDPCVDGYWFVGLEESDEFPDPNIKPEFYEQYKKEDPYVSKEYKENLKIHKGRDRWWILSEIMVGLKNLKAGKEINFDKKETDDYLKNVLFEKGSKVFQANLYPLGRKRFGSSFKDHYSKTFGINQNEYKRYYSIVSETRFPQLYKFWKQCSPRFTVCFGKAEWETFKLLFLKQEEKEFRQEQCIIIFTNSKIILTPYLNYQFIKNGREGLKQLIKILYEFY